MSEVQTTPRLSLFQIEAELLGLIDAREDVLERIQAVPEGSDGFTEKLNGLAQEVATIDGLMHDYIKAEIKKVDGIAFHIKEFTARSEAKAKAAADLQRAADRDAETAKRIKSMVLEVMQEFGEKKLPGRLFTITRQGNGGVQALTIAQPDLIPFTHKRVIVKCSQPIWRLIRAYLERFWGDNADMTYDELFQRIEVEAEPDPAVIRRDLESQQGVPGCRLEERGEHIRIK